MTWKYARAQTWQRKAEGVEDEDPQESKCVRKLHKEDHCSV